MNTESIHIQETVPPSPKLEEISVLFRPTIAPSFEIEETDFSLEEPVQDGVDHIPAFITEDEPATQIPGMDLGCMLDELNEDNLEGKRSYKRFLKGRSCSGIISEVLSYACENSRPRKRINKSS